MKKLVLVSVIVSFLCLITSCTKGTEQFQESSHPRDDQYAAEFPTQYKKEGNLSLHIEARIYNDEIATSMFDRIKADYKQIKELGKGIEEPVTFYIVDQTITGKPQVIDREIFCTYNDIKSGEYRRAFTAASFNLKSYWKSVGLDWYIFDSIEGKDVIDKEVLKSFYEDETNGKVLSLIPAYFLDTFSDAATISMAKDTACLLTSYIIDQHDIKFYLGGEKANQNRQGWLEDIGVTSPFIVDASRLDQLDYDESVNYPLIAKYKNLEMHFIKSDGEQNADDIYLFIAEIIEGYSSMIADITISDPKTLAYITEREKQVIYIELRDITASINYSKPDNTIITYQSCYTYGQIMEALLPITSPENTWLNVGVEQVLSLPKTSEYMPEKDKQKFFELMTKGPLYNQTDKNNKEFTDYMSNYYEKNIPLPKEAADLDMALFYEAVGMGTLTQKKLSTSLGITLFTVMGKEKVEVVKGNDLSIPEAYVVTQYLIKTYGLDTVISVVKGEESFSTAFQKDFEQMMADFMTEKSSNK